MLATLTLGDAQGAVALMVIRRGVHKGARGQDGVSAQLAPLVHPADHRDIMIFLGQGSGFGGEAAQGDRHGRIEEVEEFRVVGGESQCAFEGEPLEMGGRDGDLAKRFEQEHALHMVRTVVEMELAGAVEEVEMPEFADVCRP